MRILFLGDVFGRAGRNAIINQAKDLKEELRLDALIVNAENAAHGLGITPDIAESLFKAGVDVITLGDHAFDKDEIFPYLDSNPNIIRPINYPAGSPGRSNVIFQTPRGKKLLVVAVLANVFMRDTDDGFRLMEEFLAKHPLKSAADAIFVDMHGEATSEKQAMGYFLDGRVSAVVGTHTHVPTSDTRILPKGTGFQTDAGMVGDYDSVIGAKVEEPLRRFVRKIHNTSLDPAIGEATLSGTMVELDDKGLTRHISAFIRGPHLVNITPGF